MADTAQSRPSVKINLLTQDEFSSSGVGRVLLWALSVGRYIVVFTELIVILSFLSRFKLDRDLTDLNEQIEKQKAIINSYQELEKNFRLTQNQLTFVEEKTPSVNAAEALEILRQSTPPDVRLETMGLNPNGISMSATALSMQGFAQFIRSLLDNQNITDVSLGEVKVQAQGLIIEFDVSSQFTQE